MRPPFTVRLFGLQLTLFPTLEGGSEAEKLDRCSFPLPLREIPNSFPSSGACTITISGCCHPVFFRVAFSRIGSGRRVLPSVGLDRLSPVLIYLLSNRDITLTLLDSIVDQDSILAVFQTANLESWAVNLHQDPTGMLRYYLKLFICPQSAASLKAGKTAWVVTL